MQISLTALNSLHRAHFTGGGRIKPVAEYGCYYCARVYSGAEHPIQEWVDGELTALCPVCGIDAVVPKICGVNFTHADLEALHNRMFA